MLVSSTWRNGYRTHSQLMRIMDGFILKSRFSFYGNERIFGEKRLSARLTLFKEIDRDFREHEGTHH